MKVRPEFLYEIRRALLELKLISSLDEGVMVAAKEFNKEEVKKLYLSGNYYPSLEDLKECRTAAAIKAHYLYLKGIILKRVSVFFSESKLQKGYISFRSPFPAPLCVKEVEELKKLVKKMYYFFFFHTSSPSCQEFSFINALMGALECIGACLKGSKVGDIAWVKFKEAAKMYFDLEEKIPFLL